MKIQEIFEQEQLSLQQMVDKILDNCQPFLKNIDYDPYSYVLRRSIKRIDEGPFVEKNTRRDRKPKDMRLDYHNIIDEWFYKKFGHRYRSGAVFADGMTSIPNYAYVLYPIDNFEVVWSPDVDDLYDYVLREKDEFARNHKDGDTMEARRQIRKKLDENPRDFLTKILEKGNYKKGNIKEAIKSKHEIMIKCDRYYLISHSVFKHVAKELVRKMK